MTDASKKAVKCAVCESTDCAGFIKTRAQMHDDAEEFSFDRCANCGYVFLNPPVLQSELKNYYTEFYLPYRGAEAWGKYSVQVEKSDRRLYQKRADWLGEFQKLGEKSLILDVGCGRPGFLEACVEKYGCRAVGLDFSDEGWCDAPTDAEKITLIAGEIDDLPEDIFFDAVTMWHYLEHDYAPARALREIARRSHSETVLMIEVPDFESVSREKFGACWAGFHTPRHISVFSEKNLRLLLEKNGWEIIEFRRYGTLDPFVLYWMSAMEQKGFAWNRSLESEFWPFVARLLAFWPTKLREKKTPLGLMTAIARRKT